MFKIPNEYKLIKEFDLKDISSRGYLLSHIKTNARIALVENDDDNKVFYIGFRTPPKDSTGVAHILEHSVLCGSDKYPIKDPFIELAKGSLNTFLNAMTYPDKTIYPVASENDKDFKNLMDVYLDAVLHPNIYKDEKIFRQEGWHYEFSESDDSLFVNGVVYNEMKGAFSSPDEVLEREIFNSLFPDNAYAYDSGGDPKDIPYLTYQDFLDFHGRYYHPSNSYIYLYGNCDMEERLTYLDREYLSKYESIDIDSAIQMQKPFSDFKDIVKEYPVAEGDDVEENTYMTLNYVVEDALDPTLYQAFTVLDYALLSSPGSPLRLALVGEDIGKDIVGGYSNGVLQPYFTIGVKSAASEKKEKFLSTVERVLREQIDKGIDEDALKAAINVQEFSFREADFGSYPKGLIYGLICLDSWLYDDANPFMHLMAIDIFNDLKAKIGTGYFEKLIGTYLLDNTHKSILLLEPKEGLMGERDEALRKTMEDYKATLSEDKIKSIKEECKALKAFQSEPTSPQDLLKLPLLERGDMRKEIRKIKNRMDKVEDISVLYHDVDTNGIIYTNLLFDVGDVPIEDIRDLAFAVRAMGLVDTQNYTYAKLANEINIKTGGIYTNLQCYDPVDSDIKRYFVVSSKFLKESTKDAFALIEEMLFSTKWIDKKRIRELVNQEILHYRMKIMSAGHSISRMRAGARFSKDGYFTELTMGIEFFNYLKDFEEHFDERIDKFCKKAEDLFAKILRSKSLLISVTAKKELSKEIEPYVSALKKKLSDSAMGAQKDYGVLCTGNEGLKTASAVQYVARAGNFRKNGLEYDGKLRILKTILSLEYFWINVRVKGGAYGCMNGFKRNGDGFFVSYRDPNLKATNEVFENTADYISNFDADERDMTKYIIGTIGEMDTPLTPSQEGDRSLACYITHTTEEILQRDRDAVLSCNPKDIRDMAKYVSAMMDDNYLCVLGNEDAIETDKALFDSVISLN